MDGPVAGGDFPEGLEKGGAVNVGGDGLDAALDEEAGPVSALGCAGEFSAIDQQVGFLPADEALAGAGGFAAGGDGGGEVAEGEGGLEPTMHAQVAVGCAEAIPFVTGRNGEGVGPVGEMGDQTAAGGATEEGSDAGPGGDVLMGLEVAERGGGRGPGVGAQHGESELGGGFEEGFVERHVPGRFTRTGVEECPVLWGNRSGGVGGVAGEHPGPGQGLVCERTAFRRASTSGSVPMVMRR